jgi:inhibitor of KinA sporulation pathway (predicted exonuclease)
MDATGRTLWNVVDVEATCWADEPPAGMVSEIIEIGLTVLDLADVTGGGHGDGGGDGDGDDGRAAGGRGERIARHRILVRPERSAVSGFCTELTGLTQAEVETGVSFAEACTILARDHAAGVRPWTSWGDYDRKQFTRQCQASDTAYPFGARHVNAKAEFTRVHELRKRPGMAQALEFAGLPLEGRHHSGADDAWNIAALILDVMGRDSGSAFAQRQA